MRLLSRAFHAGASVAVLATLALTPISVAVAQHVVRYFPEDDLPPTEVAHEPASAPEASSSSATEREHEYVLNVPLYVPLFETPDDAHAYAAIARDVQATPVPTARAVAKAFLREQLDIDGDALVVAHFASAEARAAGRPDRSSTLTDALMQAFPEHASHTGFAMTADTIGGIFSGGKTSPGISTLLDASPLDENGDDIFKRIGKFLWSRTGPGFVYQNFFAEGSGERIRKLGNFFWSRTGPGYVYHTFFAPGNVVETAKEDSRPLDDAFGIFAAGKGFTAGAASSLRLSELVNAFERIRIGSNLPFVNRLDDALETYWSRNRASWPVVARYRFVEEACRALDRGALTKEQYAHVMQAAAPDLPLDGPITLAQLRSQRRAGNVQARRFDINGYFATDIVRFVAPDGTEVLYVPGDEEPFVALSDERALERWVLGQIARPERLDALLSHFSIYDSQDGVFWTGVKAGLEKLRDGRWKADRGTIDHADASIAGDVFEHMQRYIETRSRDDARMQVRTAWDAYRTALHRMANLAAPVGFVQPLAIPVQVGSALVGLGTGMEQAMDGRSADERRHGLAEGVMSVVSSVPMAFAFSGSGPGGGEATASGAQRPAFVPPRRINGRVGYPMSPVGPARLPAPGEGLPEAAIESNLVGGAQTPPRYRPDRYPVPFGRGHFRLPPQRFPSISENEVFSQYDTDSLHEDRPAPVHVDRTVELGKRGYIELTVVHGDMPRTRSLIDLKKWEVDTLRHRLDDFRLDDVPVDEATGRHVPNERGIVSGNHSIVYRVDARSPERLLAQGGFGHGLHFDAIEPMIPGVVAMGSGSLRGSNTVFDAWNREGYAGKTEFNQYAVWTEGHEVASALDNVPNEVDLDEVHFPGDVSARDRIFIIDASDEAMQKAIADIIDSPFVSTPLGVPLRAFVGYRNGTLNIHAPNEFSLPAIRHPGADRTPDGSLSDSVRSDLSDAGGASPDPARM